MLTVQPVPTAGPGLPPLRAARPAEALVTGGASAGNAAVGNPTRDRGDGAGSPGREAALRGDPAAPLGPPPAFEANLLEAERSRQHDRPAAHTPPGQLAVKPGAAASAYAGFGQQVPGRLDMAR